MQWKWHCVTSETRFWESLSLPSCSFGTLAGSQLPCKKSNYTDTCCYEGAQVTHMRRLYKEQGRKMTGPFSAGVAILAKWLEVKKSSCGFWSQKMAHGEEPKKYANSRKVGPRCIIPVKPYSNHFSSFKLLWVRPQTSGCTKELFQLYFAWFPGTENNGNTT